MPTEVMLDRCDLCGGTDLQTRGRVRDHLLCIDGEHTLQRCRTCRLHFVNPRPDASTIGRFYPPDYAEHQDARVTKLARWEQLAGDPDRRPSLLDRIRIALGEARSYQVIPPAIRDAAILDVGCASGTFLDKMALLGWRTHGIEQGARAAQIARGKGHEVVEARVEQGLPYGDATFDVVYCWHVLEHTYSPAAVLREIWRVLKPGGFLVMAVPNHGGLQSRVFGRFWSKLEPPRHLFHFQRRQLRRHLVRAGLDEEIAITTRTGATSWWRNLRCLANGVFGTKVRRDVGWLIALFEVPVFLAGLCRFFGAGSDLRAVARKPLSPGARLRPLTDQR